MLNFLRIISVEHLSTVIASGTSQSFVLPYLNEKKEQIIITSRLLRKHNFGSGNPIQAVAW